MQKSQIVLMWTGRRLLPWIQQERGMDVCRLESLYTAIGTVLVFDGIPRTECKQQQWKGSHCSTRKAKVIALGYHYSVSTFPRILLPGITYLSKLVQYTCSSALPAGTCHGLTDARWTSISLLGGKRRSTHGEWFTNKILPSSNSWRTH